MVYDCIRKIYLQKKQREKNILIQNQQKTLQNKTKLQKYRIGNSIHFNNIDDLFHTKNGHELIIGFFPCILM